MGPREEREGDFGVGFQAEEGLLEDVRGERDAGELEGGFGGVEGVVVVEEEGGDEVCVGGGHEGGEERQWLFVRVRMGRRSDIAEE